MHGSLAILDNQRCLAFVSEHFLAALGSPDELVGHEAHHLLPALAPDDPRQLRQQLDAGERVEFEQQCTSAAGDTRWYRLTVVPSSALGDGLHSVVFGLDITSMSQRLNQIRDATADLTEVENQRRRRINRDVHDGPVQLLAALAIRLGMNTSESAKELQQVASDVASTLRTVIDDFSPAIDRSASSQLEEWIAPLLVGTALEVEVHDDRTDATGPAEAQAAFVLLYLFVRTLRDTTSQRTLTLRLSDHRGGELFELTVQSKPPLVAAGKRAVRLKAVTHHAQTLGGALAHSLDENNVRTLTMWIPKLTRPSSPTKQPVKPSQNPLSIPQNNLASLPPLTDAAWQNIVKAAPERMADIDEHRRVMFANEMMMTGIGLPEHEVIGMTSEALLGLGVVDPSKDGGRLLRRLQTGERINTHWYRTDSSGTSRQIRLALSPRFSADGRWQGMFVATDDRHELDLLDALHNTALSDLTQARRLATERSVQLLDQPLAKIEEVIELLEKFAPDSSDPEAMHKIKVALSTTLQSIRSSSDAFTTPSLSITDIGDALRQSLGMLLDGCDLVVVGTTDASLPRDLIDVVFRIVREAANNAVLHGRADIITVTLAAVDNGISCAVHDNGIGINPSDLEHQPGHLGTRSMQARARERGGTCRIEPHSEIGTLVDLWLPIDPHQRRPHTIESSPTG